MASVWSLQARGSGIGVHNSMDGYQGDAGEMALK
jgi:hypothetical protein